MPNLMKYVLRSREHNDLECKKRGINPNRMTDEQVIDALLNSDDSQRALALYEAQNTTPQSSTARWDLVRAYVDSTAAPTPPTSASARPPPRRLPVLLVLATFAAIVVLFVHYFMGTAYPYADEHGWKLISDDWAFAWLRHEKVVRNTAWACLLVVLIYAGCWMQLSVYLGFTIHNVRECFYWLFHLFPVFWLYPLAPRFPANDTLPSPSGTHGFCQVDHAGAIPTTDADTEAMRDGPARPLLRPEPISMVHEIPVLLEPTCSTDGLRRALFMAGPFPEDDVKEQDEGTTEEQSEEAPADSTPRQQAGTLAQPPADETTYSVAGEEPSSQQVAHLVEQPTEHEDARPHALYFHQWARDLAHASQEDVSLEEKTTSRIIGALGRPHAEERVRALERTVLDLRIQLAEEQAGRRNDGIRHASRLRALNRQLFMAKGSFWVVVRLHAAANDDVKAANIRIVPGNVHALEVRPTRPAGQANDHTRFQDFAHVFPNSASNSEVWEALRPVVDALIEDDSLPSLASAIVTDGQSGSGKSYTTFSRPDSVAGCTAALLFPDSDRLDYRREVSCAIGEVYLNKAFDLTQPGQAKTINKLVDLAYRMCKSSEELASTIQAAEQRASMSHASTFTTI